VPIRTILHRSNRSRIAAAVVVVTGGVGEGPGEPDALVELPDGEQPGVARELAL
jgi:hypothetical protein